MLVSWSLLRGRDDLQATGKQDTDESNQEPTTDKILGLHNRTIDFGGVREVSDLTLAIASGEQMGLNGLNAADRTTVFNLVTNADQATFGDILLKSKSLRGLYPGSICHLGSAP